MSRSGSLSSYKLRSLVQQLNRDRYWSGCNSKGHNISLVSAASIGYRYPIHQSLQLYHTNNGLRWRSKRDAADMEKNDVDIGRSPTPTPPQFSFPNWIRWFLGSMLSLLLPFWKQKWEKLKMIEGEAETVVEEVEHVAELVEKVANMAEKASTEVAEKLPDDSKLKDAALLVERVSKATAHDAQLTVNFIEKVDELKQDLGNLETFIEPVVDKIAHKESRGK